MKMRFQFPLEPARARLYSSALRSRLQTFSRSGPIGVWNTSLCCPRDAYNHAIGDTRWTVETDRSLERLGRVLLKSYCIYIYGLVRGNCVDRRRSVDKFCLCCNKCIGLIASFLDKT